MAPLSIPLHHLPGHLTGHITVERFAARAHPVRNEVHRHDFHELFFIGEGSGEHMVDLTVHPFRAPCMHAIAPGQVHRLARSADSCGSVVMFQREAIDQHGGDQDVRTLFTPWNDRPALVLSASQLAEAAMLIDLLEKETRVDGASAMRIAAGLLHVLLAKAAQWMRSAMHNDERRAENTTGPDIVRRFITEVEADFITERRVTAYAERYAVSADHLSALLRERIGKSAMDVLQERLMLEARRLLLHGDMSVKEVGFALNMDDPAYFSRVFKKATGMTPAEYRTHIREVYKG